MKAVVTNPLKPEIPNLSLGERQDLFNEALKDLRPLIWLIVFELNASVQLSNASNASKAIFHLFQIILFLVAYNNHKNQDT